MRAFTHQVMIFEHNGQRIIQVMVQAWTIISGFHCLVAEVLQ